MEQPLKDTEYKLTLTKDQMRKIGFRYDFDVNDYVYKFPVYINKGIPLLFCKLGIFENSDDIWFNVYNEDESLCRSYYERNYGRNDVIKEIDKRILKELKMIGVRKQNGSDKYIRM